MAYLKGGTIIDGDLTVEGSLYVKDATTFSSLYGMKTVVVDGVTKEQEVSSNEAGIPTEEPDYWKFTR